MLRVNQGFIHLYIIWGLTTSTPKRYDKHPQSFSYGSLSPGWYITSLSYFYKVWNKHNPDIICRVSFTLAWHEIATLYPSGEIWEHWKVWPYLFSFSSMDASFSISSSFATSIISSMNLSVCKFGGSKGSALNIANACKIAPLTPLMWAWVIKAFSLAFYWDKRERATVITGKEQFIHGY